MHEIKVREALKGGLQRSPGTLPKIPGYVPSKVGLLNWNTFMCYWTNEFIEMAHGLLLNFCNTPVSICVHLAF